MGLYLFFQYPKWLEDNSSKVSEKDLENYTKQFELMKTIVHEYESEGTGDSEDVKKKRFEKILDTMQKMQELGQPPKDLIGDMVSISLLTYKCSHGIL